MNQLERMLATISISAIGLVGQLQAETRETIIKTGMGTRPYIAGEIVKDDNGNVKDIITYSDSEAYNNNISRPETKIEKKVSQYEQAKKEFSEKKYLEAKIHISNTIEEFKSKNKKIPNDIKKFTLQIYQKAVETKAEKNGWSCREMEDLVYLAERGIKNTWTSNKIRELEVNCNIPKEKINQILAYK